MSDDNASTADEQADDLSAGRSAGGEGAILRGLVGYFRELSKAAYNDAQATPHSIILVQSIARSVTWGEAADMLEKTIFGLSDRSPAVGTAGDAAG